MFRRRVPLALAVSCAVLLAAGANAQTLGTFRWQLQPFCNVVTVTVIQHGAGGISTHGSRSPR